MLYSFGSAFVVGRLNAFISDIMLLILIFRFHRICYAVELFL